MANPILSADDMAVLRADAESVMLDELLVQRPTGRKVQDPVTWLEDAEFADLFTTFGKVAGESGSSDPAPRTVVIGGVERVVIRGGVSVPVSVPEIRSGDRLTVIGAGFGSDPELLGNRYRVVSVPAKSWATQRRLDVVEV